MKTTVEIADPLFARARRVAARDGETLPTLIESGLTRELAARATTIKPFKLREVTVAGSGLQPEVAHLSMSEIIQMSYGDRGG